VKVLTDTHALFWAVSAPQKLSIPARDAMDSGEVFASVVNLWEMLLKKDKPDSLTGDPASWWDRYIVRSGIPTVGIYVKHVLALAKLPEIHKDPFDRMLVAQAMAEKASLVSKDSFLSAYKVPIIW
jgi:PIN domain nuclease of toxin-antitoxin system